MYLAAQKFQNMVKSAEIDYSHSNLYETSTLKSSFLYLHPEIALK